jgi:hypothetical protein
VEPNVSPGKKSPPTTSPPTAAPPTAAPPPAERPNLIPIKRKMGTSTVPVVVRNVREKTKC